MYQSAASSQSQGQLKKSSGRNKPLEVTHANEKGKKSIPIPGGATNRAPARRPVKIYNKQVNSGGREKAFSKNERKLTGSESRHYMEKNPNERNEEFVVQSLLNFQYSSGRNIESNNSRRYQLSRRKKTYFNKEEYLQAKCQFVVIGSANDYFLHAADPDKLVEWDQIQLVYLPSHDPPNCPICLYSPVAAKMTRCGHIFCWSCILHYLHLSDKAWRKCPICHEAVHKSDLKSVKCNVQKRYERLDSVTMKLMRRAKDSVFAMPISEAQLPMVEFSSWIDHASNSGSKIMLASPEEVLQHILIKERNELRAQLDIDVADENGEDAFISMALQISEESIKSFKLKELKELPLECVETDVKDEGDIYDVDGNGSNLSAMLKDTSLGCHIETAFSDDESDVSDVNKSYEVPMKAMSEVGKVGKSYLRGRVSESSISSEQSIMEETHVEEIDSGQDGGSVASSVSSDYTPKTNGYVDSYYFYQADDGQNIFLHSLNARCLIEEYGTLDGGPLKITGQIIDFECFTMTKELRKRFRYLSHLPLSSEFMICELILKPPLLSKNTIHNFMPEFKNRKALRLKKFKEQQKFDRRATNAGNKQHGFRSIDYDDDDDISIDLSNTADFPSGLSPEADECDVKCKERKEEPGTQQQFNGPSFAQMLNKKSEEISPRKEHISMPTVVRPFRALESIHPSPRGERTVNDDDDGPEIVAPDFKQTFSAAMFAAPMKQEGGPSAAKGKNGKKKKEKGMLLFATGGQRKY